MSFVNVLSWQSPSRSMTQPRGLPPRQKSEARILSSTAGQPVMPPTEAMRAPSRARRSLLSTWATVPPISAATSLKASNASCTSSRAGGGGASSPFLSWSDSDSW